MLNREDFSHVVRSAPLVSIDHVIRDSHGRVLVGLRENEPARGTYFVPGGVIGKNERLNQAFSRILQRETGISADIGSARFLGAYEHFYETNRFGEPGFGTHYVVLAYETRLDGGCEITPDDQHSTVAWMTEAEILGSPQVHDNTKAYFLPRKWE